MPVSRSRVVLVTIALLLVLDAGRSLYARLGDLALTTVPREEYARD
jgi:hypothetical protein